MGGSEGCTESTTKLGHRYTVDESSLFVAKVWLMVEIFIAEKGEGVKLNSVALGTDYNDP